MRSGKGNEWTKFKEMTGMCVMLQVWSALILYRQILDSIEANGYDNFTQRAYVPKWKKLRSLPVSYWMVMENNMKEIFEEGK